MGASTNARTWHRAIGELRRDDGMALATVAAMSAIMFLLATTLIMIVTQQQVSTSHLAARTKALHVADAGLNAYLYYLRQNPTYWSTHPTMGPTATQDGNWVVYATPPSSSGAPVTLRSVGTVPSVNTSRTIVAQVRYPTFADYACVYNGSVSYGSDTVVEGKVRANGNISNSGRITGRAMAGGTVSGSGVFEAGYDQNQPILNFSTIVTDMDGMKVKAQATGHYIPSAGSGYLGYRVILNGNSLTYQKVTAVNSTTGALTLSGSAVNLAFPVNGVIYFEGAGSNVGDTIWLSGMYSERVTIVAGSDTTNTQGSKSPYDGSAMFIPDNLYPDDEDGDAVLGIVTLGDISLPAWYTSCPNNLNVVAALLTKDGTVHSDQTPSKNNLRIKGCRVQATGGNFSGGFTGDRTYVYDARLDANPPPSYPPIRDGSLKINSWIEH